MGDSAETTAPAIIGPAPERRRTIASPVMAVVLSPPLIILLAFMPHLLSLYQLHVLTLVCIYVPLVLGQNFITGNSGQLSIGHAAFYGLGAYTVGILAGLHDWATMPSLIAAIAVAGLAGIAVGLPAIRVSGDYLFIVTIGINLVFIDVVTQWVPVTGGTSGIPGLPEPIIAGLHLGGNAAFYEFSLLVAVLCVGLLYCVTRSRFGSLVEAIRDDALAAAACGISATPIKLSVFVFSAAMAGLAGGMLAYFIGFVGPGDFGPQQSILIFEMAILGGLGSIPGAILGAAILIIAPEVFRFLQPYRLGIIGLLMIVLMTYRPQGLLGRVKVTNLIRR
jgi:branched-chain amino acid transport system permease protein